MRTSSKIGDRLDTLVVTEFSCCQSLSDWPGVMVMIADSNSKEEMKKKMVMLANTGGCDSR